MDNTENQQTNLQLKTTRNINDTNWAIIAVAENKKNNQVIQLLTENLLQIQFINSIQSPVPQLQILYRDYTFSLNSFLNINNVILYINIIAASVISDIDPINYTGEFLLSDFKLKMHEKDFNIYSLSFKHIDILKLLQNVNYSTNKETLTGQVSPYKIISDINNLIKNPFETNYVETTRKIDFITSQNSSALQVINYCLKMRSRR